MSLYDYRSSAELSRLNPPFYALIMAAMRQADTSNMAKLKAAWPDVYAEMEFRYNAPGGMTPAELAKDRERRELERMNERADQGEKYADD